MSSCSKRFKLAGEGIIKSNLFLILSKNKYYISKSPNCRSGYKLGIISSMTFSLKEKQNNRAKASVFNKKIGIENKITQQIKTSW